MAEDQEHSQQQWGVSPPVSLSKATPKDIAATDVMMKVGVIHSLGSLEM